MPLCPMEKSVKMHVVKLCRKTSVSISHNRIALLIPVGGLSYFVEEESLFLGDLDLA